VAPRAGAVLAGGLIAAGLAGGPSSTRRPQSDSAARPGQVTRAGGIPIVVYLRAIQFQWDFYAPVCGPLPDSPCGRHITLTAGQTYELRLYSGDIIGTDPHGFSGVSALGLSGGDILIPKDPPIVHTFTPTTLGAFDFACTNFCGIGHDGMSGTITIVPACGPAVTSMSPTWGPTAGGSLVTISGSCFVSGATVSFGGTPATGVAVAGSSTITATTPAHVAGPVNVVVTNPDTQSATVTNGFTYGAGGFFTVAPCRIVDTRNAAGPYGGPALGAGAARLFTATGQCGIPSSAKALTGNVTVTQSTAPGHLTVYPGGTPLSNVSTINYAQGQARANNALLPLDGSGRLGVSCSQASGTAHFLLDVSGYFQ
jgi:hypothetical protein